MVNSNAMTDNSELEPKEELPKPVKKKKKKKKPSTRKPKPSQETTVTPEVEETLETVLTLPVKPDEWVIHPATYTPEGEQLTEDTFVFMKDGIEIITIPFTRENFLGLQAILSTYFPDEDKTADLWTIKAPLNAEIDPNPVMSLTRNGVLLATTPLDQKALKQMVRTLNSYIIKPPTLAKYFSDWWGKHKILRVLLVTLLAPIALLIGFSLISELFLLQ